MSAVAVAIGGAAVIGAVASSNASRGAAAAESDAAGRSLDLQKAEFNQEQANAQPWMTAGQNALGELQSDLPSLDKNFSMQDFQESPGYQFQLNQGMQAMQRSAASKGLLNSVGTQQGLNNYAQGAANTDYQQAMNNYLTQNQNKYNMLLGLSNQGLQGTGMANAAGANYITNASNTMQGLGNAQAAGTVGSANAVSSGLSGVANGYMNYNLMSNMLKSPTTGLTMPQIGSPSGFGASSSPGAFGYESSVPTSYNSPTFGNITD